MNVGQWATKRALLDPNKMAFKIDDRVFTNDEFNRRVNQLAHALLDEGVAKGDRIAALLLNCCEFVETLFATSKIGAIMVPLNFRLAGPELDYIINDAEAGMLIYGANFAETIDTIRDGLTSVESYFVVDGPGREGDRDYEDLLSGGSAEEPKPQDEVDLDDAQFIMYTSGTTGRPKGAILTHGNTLWNSVNAILAFGSSANDISLVSAPLFHIGALSVSVTPIIHQGGSCVIQRTFDPKQALEMLDEEGITMMFGVPAMFLFMSQLPEFHKCAFRTVRYFITGGAPVPISLIKTYQEKGVDFRQGYGLTETAPGVCGLTEADSIRKAGSAGRPYFHLDVRIVGDNDEDVPVGQVGEIAVRGPIVMKGYWNKPEETRRAMRNGWFHTGDLARMDEEGYIYIVDRKKDMIISGGENIYPAEIEEVLYRNPKIAEAAVIGLPDPKWGETPVAVVAVKPGEQLSEQELIDFCQGKIARYKTPKRVIFEEMLPRTPTGKVLKKDLRGRYR